MPAAKPVELEEELEVSVKVNPRIVDFLSCGAVVECQETPCNEPSF